MEVGLPARFSVAAWNELPERSARQFDLVLCLGNAICHCRNERDMLASLRAMHAVLKPGGKLHLDSRAWEDYRKRRVRFDAFAPKEVDGERLLWLNVRHYPARFSDEHLTEVVIVSEREGKSSCRVFPVRFYPFRATDLKRRLRAAGFRRRVHHAARRLVYVHGGEGVNVKRRSWDGAMIAPATAAGRIATASRRGPAVPGESGERGAK